MLLATLALVFAMVGTAVAGPDAITSAVSKQKVKQIAKKQAKKQIRKKAPGLSVQNADQLGGVDADQYQERLFAVVAENATLVRGANAVSVDLAATAIYDVVFNRNVATCAYVATLGSPGSILGPPGYAVVAQDPTNLNGVRVRTHQPNGALLPTSFHLQVAC